jgi:hypothetical protein
MNLFFIIGLISGFTSCQSIQNKQISLNSVKSETQNKPEFHSIKVGAENTVAYLDLLKNKISHFCQSS